MKKTILFAATIMAMVSSCSNNAAKTDNNECSDTLKTDTIQGSAAIPTFESIMGTWKLAQVKDEVIENADSTYFLALSDTVMTAQAGCNYIGGAINRTGRSVDFIAFDNVFATQKLCEDMAKEQKLVEAVNAVRKFSFAGDTLVLSNEDAEAIIKLVK